MGENSLLTAFDAFILTTGLGIVQMQAQDKPLRSHRLHQHCYRFARWIFVRFRW